jgi:hypothetical protein
VLEVLAPGCGQGSIQLLGPFLVSPGEPKHPIGGQPEFMEYRPERLPSVDGVGGRRRTSTGRRACDRARPQARWVSLCARRQRVHLHPLCQRADVPCPAPVTTGKLAGAYRSPWLRVWNGLGGFLEAFWLLALWLGDDHSRRSDPAAARTNVAVSTLS